MKIIKKIMQIETGDDKAMKHDIFTFLHPNTEISEPKPKNNQSEEDEEKQSLIIRFIEYDDRVIRKKIIPNWPQVKEDNNNISRKK